MAYVTETGLKATLNAFLGKLKTWLPIQTKEDKVVITGPTYKEAMEIDVDGEIKIIGTNQDPISLRSWINSKGTVVVDSVEEAQEYVKSEFLGTLIYIKNGTTDYIEGLYVISVNSNGGQPMLAKLGTTTASSEGLDVRMDKVENWIESPLSNTEIDILTDDDPTNDEQVLNNNNDK